MKKLNITKEQFEKSRYFKNKYGTLEYVSESGNVFKTDKGKVLMFKESIVDDEQKWNDELWDCIITDVQSLGDEISSALIDADGNPTYDFEAAVKVARNAVSQEIADEVGEDITFTNELSQFVTPMEYASRIVDYVIKNKPTKSIARALKNKRSKYAESSKKFGRKFSESDAEIGDAVQDAYDKYSACRTEPKVCQAIKINDDGTEQKTSIWMDRGNSIGGIVKAIQDGRLRRVLKFSESSRKFVKESYHGRVKVEASIIATGRTAEEALEFLHNRLLDADAKITDGNEKPNPEIVDKYNYWFDENMGDVDFDICRDNNSNGFLQMDIKAI